MFSQKKADANTSVRVCVAVLVRDERGYILLEKRSDCGLWGLPGGRIEPGESVVQTAEREMKEETGYKIKVVRLLGVYSDPQERIVVFPDNVIQIVDILVEAVIISGDLRCSPESLELKFFAPLALPLEDEIIPAARIILQDILIGNVGVIR
jgi:8-oxo-dGTP pyrophosphatase MutT (NUDIX family)